MSLKARVEALLEVLEGRALLTIKDLARRYGVHPDTVVRWHHRGVLPKPVYLKGSFKPLWRPCDVIAAETRNPRLYARSRPQSARA